MNKLCIITYKYNNEWWIEKVVRNLINWLIDKYEIHIITSEVKDVQDSRIIFHKIKLFSNVWIFNWIQFFFFSYFKFKKINKIYKFDIIHKHATSLIKSDFFTAHSVHKVWLERDLSHHKQFFKKICFLIVTLYPFSIFLEYLNLFKTKYIIAISQWVKIELLENYPINFRKNIIVISNWIEIKKACGSTNKKEQFNLIFVGKRFKSKWLDLTIQVMDILVNRYDYRNITLNILWEDIKNKSYYKKLVNNLWLSKYIFFLGNKKNIYSFYKASKILISPSYYESFWLAIWEAMSCKVVPLTSLTSGSKELIKNWFNWYLLSRQAEAYANKIIELYDNVELLNTIWNNARKYVIENYSWDKIIERHIELYNNFS